MKKNLLFLLVIFSGYLAIGQNINLKIAPSTNYLNGSTYAFGSKNVGTTNTITFTIENTVASTNLILSGTPKVELSGVGVSQFSLVSSGVTSPIVSTSAKTFTVSFVPNTIGGPFAAKITIANNSVDTSENSYVINFTGTGNVSKTAAIILTAASPSTIPYKDFQEDDITSTSNGFEIAKFTLKDGASASDLDNLPTTLTDLTFNVTNFENIRSLALYDGTTEVGSDESGDAIVTFNDLNISAPDNGIKIFTVLATFNEVVVDNQSIQLTIANAISDPNGSNFTFTNGGTVSTTGATSTAGANKIAVVATKLNFAEQPSDTDTYAIMSPSVVVEAVDILGNLDFNYASSVTISTTGTFQTALAPLNVASVTASGGVATFNSVVHSIDGIGLFLTANSGSLTSIISDPFNIAAASGASNKFRSRISVSGKWNDIASWETSGDGVNWTASTLVPNSLANTIEIQTGHTITCDTTEDADQLRVSLNGFFIIASSGAFTLSNGSGVDLSVYGTFEFAGGTFDQTGASISFINTGTTLGGKYLHSKPSSTLTLPIATWGSKSLCRITGLNNANPITPTNIGQSFYNMEWDNPNQLAFVNLNNVLFKTLATFKLLGSSANKICINNSGNFNNTLTAVTVSAGTLVGYSGAGSGILSISTLVTNVLGNFIFNESNQDATLNASSTASITNDSFFTISNGPGISTLNFASSITLALNGQLILSNNSGSAILNTKNAFALNNNSKVILINSASSGNASINLTVVGKDLKLANTSKLFLETVSSPGVATVNISRSFSSTSTAVPAVDFGTGNVTGNAINIGNGGNFTKSGNGTFTTTSANPATGFVFGTGNHTFSYSGTASSGVNFTVNSIGIFTINTNYIYGTNASSPVSVFAINGGTLNLKSFIFTGNATKAQFNIASGVTILTTNTSGLGVIGTLGNFINFTSIGNTPANGRVVFGANCNYTFQGTTTTSNPFPVGGVWESINNLSIETNVISNLTTPITVNGIFKINAIKKFTLKGTMGSDIKLKGTAIIDGTLDTNGDSQILQEGGTATFTINDTFITRNPNGFNGPNAAIPTIPITMANNAKVIYAGADQIITPFANYQNVEISGTGVKILGSNSVTINKELNVTSSLLQIKLDKTLSVADKITTVDNDGTKGITVDDGGSLVQINPINNTANNNSGKIRIFRFAKPMFRYDYTYWSSPITTSVGFTLNDLSPLTLADKYLRWGYNSSPQAWQIVYGGTEVMQPGSGYAVRAPQNFPIENTSGATAQNFNTNFIGIPNNGTVTFTISGSVSDNLYNLLGNPYPSALDAQKFLDTNTNLEGTIYFWTHNSSVVNTAGTTTYVYNPGDYASWNSTGGAATSSDPSGNNNFNSPSGKINSGQAFFVKGKANGVINFTNDMRVSGENNQFFRSVPTEPVQDWSLTGNHRVWLNLTGEIKGFSQALIGYIEGATNVYDDRYDGESFGGNQVTLYSILDTKELVIQGRALPFNIEDQVVLGYNSTANTNLTVSIDHLDGLLEGQAIYLQDNNLNIVHNLKESPYTFSTLSGTFNSRFVLRYTTLEILANPTFTQQVAGLTIQKNNDVIRVNSTYDVIDEVEIFDIMGRLLFEINGVNNTVFERIQNSKGELLIVRVQLKNGGIVSKKVL